MKTLNVKLFKAMVKNGANNLNNHKNHINALNVFPVPDGDTGTNMSLTFNNGLKSTLSKEDNNLSIVSKSLSRGLLMGARGNSGVILSQIFRGFSLGLEDLVEASVLDVANAFKRGSEVAYSAVMKPVEGTILTVVRESSDYTLNYVLDNPDIDLKNFFEKLVDEAKISLENTPELLPVLKEVGVVDSGGAGLVLILEGFLEAIKGNTIELLEDDQQVESAQSKFQSDEFGYCTEMILRLDSEGKMTFNEDKLKATLATLGDSIVVVFDEDLVKVHIHTLTPGTVLNTVQKYGEFVTLKIDNMQEQHDEIVHNQLQLDSEKVEEKEYALVAVAAGDGLSDYFSQLRVDVIISGGQTMNPSTEDFVEKIQDLNAKNIIILPNNSNIVLAANQVKDVLEDKNIHVVETKSIIQGISACINFNPEVDVEENLANMNDVLDYVKTGEVTYAIKDTTFNNKEIKEGEYIGITNGTIASNSEDIFETLKSMVNEMIDEDDELVTIVVGSDASSETLEVLEQYIEDNFDVEVEVIEGNQPIYYFIIGVE